jgi:hypothetical protein
MRAMMEKPFETGISPDGTYFHAWNFKVPYTAAIAQALATEFAQLGGVVNVIGCLIDIRGTTSVSSVTDKYKFAYQDTKEIKVPRHWKLAFIKDKGDDSLEFIETVMLNAGYVLRTFEDESIAVDWLRES